MSGIAHTPNLARHEAVIAVPCFNERARIRAADFRRFADEHPEVGFIFVDDGSTDGTDEVLRSLCAMAPSSLRVITLPRRSGKAAAVRHGILAGLAQPKVRYVGFWDADLATPLDAICTFLRIHNDDPRLVLVMGARVQLLGRSITREAHRHYAGRVFATAASMVLSLPVYDTQCGAKLFRATALTRRVFQEPFVAKWIFDVEILARMTKWHRLATGTGIEELVYEFPLQEWQEVAGSKRTLSDYWLAVRDLMMIRYRFMRQTPACSIPRSASRVV
jgi:glycosyltransferase involved in cell wall biosynthesis